MGRRTLQDNRDRTHSGKGGVFWPNTGQQLLDTLSLCHASCGEFAWGILGVGRLSSLGGEGASEACAWYLGRMEAGQQPPSQGGRV